jgi:hypothetical protein
MRLRMEYLAMIKRGKHVGDFRCNKGALEVRRSNKSKCLLSADSIAEEEKNCKSGEEFCE